LVPGPGHGQRDRSLHIKIHPNYPEGFWVHSYAGDDPLGCRDYVRDKLGLPEFRAGSRERASFKPRPVRSAVEPKTAQQALEIWREAVSPRSTPGEFYLNSRRLELDASVIGAVQFHPRLYLDGTITPGVVSLFRDLISNEPCGIHRIFLHNDGSPILDEAGKKIRRMLGRASGAAIKLDPDGDVTLGLHIGEGVETCLAARQLGYRPVWALGSSGAIAAFPLLSGLEAVTVFAENDNASNDAAEACAQRYAQAGLEASIVQPPCGDMNDVIMKKGGP
jgi:hypothetical protein